MGKEAGRKIDENRPENVSPVVDWVADVTREELAVGDLIQRLVSMFDDLGEYKSKGSVPFDALYPHAAMLTMLQRSEEIFSKDFGEFLVRITDILEKDPGKRAEFKTLTRH